MSWKNWSILPVAALVFCASVSPARAQESGARRGERLSVTVAFGAGLNTPGTDNHHIIPPRIKVKAGGVVNFVVAGFHQVFVYQPGKTADDVIVPDTGTFVNDLDDLFYQGLSPSGDPPQGFSNAQNRVESVAFSDPGTYLVICNVRTHFTGGMFAYVIVEDDGGH
jgi:plastocyanin